MGKGARRISGGNFDFISDSEQEKRLRKQKHEPAEGFIESYAAWINSPAYKAKKKVKKLRSRIDWLIVWFRWKKWRILFFLTLIAIAIYLYQNPEKLQEAKSIIEKLMK